MTVDMWIGFALGAFVGFLIASVFAGTKFWEMHERTAELEAKSEKQASYVRHLEQQVRPEYWSEDPQRNVKVKARLYDEHENLIKPGTEVIRVQAEGDMPDLPAGWRERVGDSDEL